MINKKSNSSSFSKFVLKDRDFVGKFKIFGTIALSIILAGILVLCIWGFNLGIDFTGGTVLEVSVGAQVENSETAKNIKSTISSALSENGLKISYYQISGSGEDSKVVVRYKDISGKSEEEMQQISDIVSEKIKTELSLDEDAIEQAQRVGATATSELLVNCLLSILVIVVLMLIYIAIRFELSFGLSAIVALFHDVFVMCALMAILRIQVNSSFVAAVITIVGYSINNTIVVFDRIRENKKKDCYLKSSNKEIANVSIKETLTRTLNTSITTLFAVVLLAIIGVSAIKEFCLPIIFGLIAGTYSSIFIAGPLWAIINDKTVSKKALKNGYFGKKNKNSNSEKEDNEETEKIDNLNDNIEIVIDENN